MTSVQSFALNSAGRDFVVGDIHGCFSRLQAHLDRIGFDTACDRLFSVGDLVDRGPESHLCTEWLSQPWFHAVVGNHELMACGFHFGMIDAGIYAANGGAWFIGMTPAERSLYVSEFECLPTAIEIETAAGLVGVVHADVPTGTWADLCEALQGENADAFINLCTWSRTRMSAGLSDAIPDVRAAVVGHTPVDRWTSLGNVIYIDTGAVFRGRDFTILDLETLRPVDLRVGLDWQGD